MKQPDVISKSPVDVNLVARRARISDRFHVFLSHVTLHLCLSFCTIITKKANYPQVTLHCLGCHQSLHVLRRIYKMDNGNYSHKMYSYDNAITKLFYDHFLRSHASRNILYFPRQGMKNERREIASLVIVCDLNSEAFQVDALPSWMVLDDVLGKTTIGENLPARGALVLHGRQVLLPHMAANVPFVSGALAAKKAYKTQVALSHLFGHQEPQIILAIYKQNNEPDWSWKQESKSGTLFIQGNPEIVQVYTLPCWVHFLHVIFKPPILKHLVTGGALKAGRLHVLLAHVAFQVALLSCALSTQQANETQVAHARLCRHQLFEFELLKAEIYKMEQPN